jgi:hypothetical protein
MKIQIYEFLQVRSNNLIGVYENDFLETHREQDIKEQDLVSPNDALLLLLGSKPRWPFVGDQLVLEFVFFSQMWNEFLDGGCQSASPNIA